MAFLGVLVVFLTTLCANGTHVYRVGASACTCGQNLTKFPLSGGMMPFPNPYSPPRPPTPPVAGEAPDVSIAVFKAAQDAKATYLSSDGKRAYRDDRSKAEVAYWDEEAGTWGSWWAAAEVAADAVRM